LPKAPKPGLPMEYHKNACFYFKPLNREGSNPRITLLLFLTESAHPLALS
jgi:hypothetical protein